MLKMKKHLSDIYLFLNFTINYQTIYENEETNEKKGLLMRNLTTFTSFCLLPLHVILLNKTYDCMQEIEK